MSYCRFSSDNWKSDVYVYATGRGHCIMVARTQRVSNVQGDVIGFGHHTLPQAGEDFSFDTAAEAANKLQELKDIGFHIPDGVIEALRGEE